MALFRKEWAQGYGKGSDFQRATFAWICRGPSVYRECVKSQSTLRVKDWSLRTGPCICKAVVDSVKLKVKDGRIVIKSAI
jgi:hypothetical protein